MDGASLTRRQYLLIKAMEHGAGVILAMEAVASVAIEHPEWDMDETKSWDGWEESLRGRKTRNSGSGLQTPSLDEANPVLHQSVAGDPRTHDLRHRSLNLRRTLRRWKWIAES